MSLVELPYHNEHNTAPAEFYALVQHAVYLFVVNLPFLITRVYLWFEYEYEAEMFLIKNIAEVFGTSYAWLVYLLESSEEETPLRQIESIGPRHFATAASMDFRHKVDDGIRMVSYSKSSDKEDSKDEVEAKFY